VVISAALTYTFGRMVKDTRQGWAIFAVMGFCSWAALAPRTGRKGRAMPLFSASHVAQARQYGRQGSAFWASPIPRYWATATTDASNGSVNAMHDSFTPLGGSDPHHQYRAGRNRLRRRQAPALRMLLFAGIAMFVAGLMVGRTPEYTGQENRSQRSEMAMLAVLCLPLSILGFTALASVTKLGLAGPLNSGPHGFSEILYAFTSATGNNGSAFAGLTANTPFYNTALGFAMLIGSFPFHRADDGGGGRAGGQEDCARLGRHLSHPWRAVRRAFDRRHPDCRRSDLLPGFGRLVPSSNI